MTWNSEVSLVVLVFVMVLSNASGKCDNCSTTLANDELVMRDKALKGYDFITHLVTSALACLAACTLDCLCASINYNTSDSNGLHDCQLNYETNQSRPEALTDEKDFDYIEVNKLQVSLNDPN